VIIARDIMTPNHLRMHQRDSARRGPPDSRQSAGVLPVCGEDNRIKGMLTDRAIPFRAPFTVI
jgi:hypothetical protein